MLFSSLISQLSVLATFLSVAAAVDIQAWQGSGCDSGSSAYYGNVAHDTCVAFSNSFGVRFTSVPSGAKGHVYYNSACSNFAQEGGTGTYCLDAHNNMKSANWFYSSSKFIRREEQVGETYTGFHYTRPDGTKASILCSASEWDKLFELYNSGDFAALDAYPIGMFRVLRFIAIPF